MNNYSKMSGACVREGQHDCSLWAEEADRIDVHVCIFLCHIRESLRVIQSDNTTPHSIYTSYTKSS